MWFFSPAFWTPFLSSGPVNRTNTWSDAWHITLTLPVQQRCTQTISANVLKLLGQQVSGQKDSGIMALNKFLIGRLHNNRRPTGSRLHTLFIAQRSSLLQWPNFTKWPIELTTRQLSKQPNTHPLSYHCTMPFPCISHNSVLQLIKKLCSLKSNYESQ